MDVFFRNYFCRSEPFPPKELLPAFKNMSEDKTVRETMSVYSVTIVVSVLSFVLRYISKIFSTLELPHCSPRYYSRFR
jgi:hypothetical protein